MVRLKLMYDSWASPPLRGDNSNKEDLIQVQFYLNYQLLEVLRDEKHFGIVYMFES